MRTSSPVQPRQLGVLAKLLGTVAALCFIAVGVLSYFLVAAHNQLRQQRIEIADLERNLALTQHTLESVGLATRDLKNQVAVLRVALQQSANITIEKSGAIITKKGSKPDGIELR